jgi:hypothetical protein
MGMMGLRTGQCQGIRDDTTTHIIIIILTADGMLAFSGS